MNACNHGIFQPSQHHESLSPVTTNAEMSRCNRRAMRRYKARLSIGVEAGDQAIIRLSNMREHMIKTGDTGFKWKWLKATISILETVQKAAR